MTTIKEEIVNEIISEAKEIFPEDKIDLLTNILIRKFYNLKIEKEEQALIKYEPSEDSEIVKKFYIAKKVEGASDNTLKQYLTAIKPLMVYLKKPIKDMTTNDIRYFLAVYQNERKCGQVTLDNMRRYYNSFFQWLEDEEIIVKNPMRRIKKIKQEKRIKKPFTDEELELIRQACQDEREIAIIDILASTGMRVGELALLNRDDIDFNSAQCIVYGKGKKEREVFLNAKARVNIKKYIESRNDSNEALFVSLKSPHNRLEKGAIELIVREIGKRAGIKKVHPHRFRRTAATMALNRGMPVEQVQQMLGHEKIETTMIYVSTDKTNLKASHQKYLT